MVDGLALRTHPESQVHPGIQAFRQEACAMSIGLLGRVPIAVIYESRLLTVLKRDA